MPSTTGLETTGMRWLIAAPWFPELVTVDPTMSLRVAERCLVLSAQRVVCRPWFEKALRENPLNSAAALGLAQLAEENGDWPRASKIYRDRRRVDRSFAVLWSEWNFNLRWGKHRGDLRDAQRLALDVLVKAPPRFRGDFPLYAVAGIPSEVVAEHLRMVGSMERAMAFALFLASTGDPAAGSLAVSLLRELPENPGKDFARSYLAQGLGQRRDYKGAAEVWRTAVRRGFFPDRRASEDDDPALNPNPRLRKPFVERSFDWSQTADQRAEVSPEESAEGVRIFVRPDAHHGTVLLSKLVLLPPGSEGIRILLEPSGDPRDLKQAPVEWFAHDAVTGRVLAAARKRTGWPVTGELSPPVTSEVRFPSVGRPEAVYLGLVYQQPDSQKHSSQKHSSQKHSSAVAESAELRIRQIRFEILGGKQ